MPKKWRTKSPKKLNQDAMREKLKAALRSFALDVQSDFEKTTATWNHKPQWEPILITDSGHILRVEVSTSDDLYRLINRGSPSHAIFPVNAKVLSFPGTFAPKTKPRVLKSYPGASGPPQEAREWVAHPGFVARNFDTEIAKRRGKTLKARFDKIMAQVAKASGNSI